MTMEGKYRRLIDHAIGSLADLGNDLIQHRKNLHRIKTKKQWSDKDVKNLYDSLQTLAFKCGSTLEEWEQDVQVFLPRPQERRDDD
ncbi:MAG: hypothetical protein ACTSXE_02545 [Candidatus Thorarchaeota archaeon]